MPYSDIPDTVNTDNQNDTEPVLDPGKLPDDSDAFKFNMTCRRLSDVNKMYCTSGIVNKACHTGSPIGLGVNCDEDHTHEHSCTVESSAGGPDYSKITGLSLDCVGHQKWPSECNVGFTISKSDPDKQNIARKSLGIEQLFGSQWMADADNQSEFDVNCDISSARYNPQRRYVSGNDMSPPNVYMDLKVGEKKEFGGLHTSVLRCYDGTGVKGRDFDERIGFKLHKVEENDNGTIYTVESGIGGPGPSRITGLEFICSDERGGKLSCDGEVYSRHLNPDELLKAKGFGVARGIPELGSDERNRLYDAVCTDVTNSLCCTQESSSNYQQRDCTAGAVAVYITLFLCILVIITALIWYLRRRRTKRQQSGTGVSIQDHNEGEGTSG